MTTTSRTVLPPDLDPRRPVRRPARRHRGARIAGWLCVGLSVLLLVVSGVGYGLYLHYNGELNRIPFFGLNHGTAPVGTQAHSENFLLVGSDTRVGIGSGYGSAANISGARSDTVILAHIPADGAKPTLVSFPRDSYVEIPSYTSGGATHSAQMNKLNAAFALGGPQLLVRTIEGLTGLPINHYVEINFAGFKRMVNALGGISLCVRTPRNDIVERTATGYQGSGDVLSAGVHHVNGTQALAFVRDRHTFADGDISRIHDQQYFLAQVMKKVKSLGTLLNPLKLNAFLSATVKSIRVDKGLDLNGLKNLALRLGHIDPKHVHFVTIPFTTSAGSEPIGGIYQSVVLLDKTKDRQLFDQLSGRGASGSGASKQRTVTVPPSQITVKVENGAGINGLAAKAQHDLQRVGFTVSSIGDAQEFGASTTVVHYPPAQAAQASTLAAAIPGASLQPDSGVTGLVVVLGTDYSGAHAVKVGASTHTSHKSKVIGKSATSLSCGA